MSTRSTRINILVTPEEKAAIEATAAEKALSLSDYARQSMIQDEPDLDLSDLTREQKVELKFMVDQMDKVISNIEKTLDRSHKRHLEWKREVNALRKAHGHKEI